MEFWALMTGMVVSCFAAIWAVRKPVNRLIEKVLNINWTKGGWRTLDRVMFWVVDKIKKFIDTIKA